MSRDAFKRFKFTKREKRGSIILLLFLIGVMFLPRFFRVNHEPLVFEFTEEEKEQIEVLKIKSQSARKEREKKFSSAKKYEKNEYIPPTPTEPFDPDTMSALSWQDLGLSERQAEVLISYKVRSGGFYNVDQLYSAYVLDSNRVNSWKPFLVFNAKKPVEKKIEINSATAEELKSLKGIGEKLSERIVTFREKLGGFVSVEQIAEVYGLSPETFESIKNKITVDVKKVKSIDINTIEMKDLAAHPYFTFQMAKLIVNYRGQHGPYSNMDQMVKSKGIEIEDVRKVEPYINFAP
jgi:competence ComEA-like helix-hairpin-helix protein